MAGAFYGVLLHVSRPALFSAPPRVKREKAFYPQPVRKRAARHQPWHFLCPGQQSNEEPPRTGIFWPRPEGEGTPRKQTTTKANTKTNANPAPKTEPQRKQTHPPHLPGTTGVPERKRPPQRTKKSAFSCSLKKTLHVYSRFSLCPANSAMKTPQLKDSLPPPPASATLSLAGVNGGKRG